MKIAVLSRDERLYSTSSIVKAGKKRGHTMVVVDHTECDIILENDKLSLVYDGAYISTVDAIIPRIGSSATYVGTSIVKQFEINNVFSINSASAILNSRDKLISQQILMRNGVNMPKSCFTSNDWNLNYLINKVGGCPVIIKAIKGTHGLGVVLAESQKSAKSMIEAFQNLKSDVIIQEYIPESKGSDIRVLVVNGEVVGAMKRQGEKGEFRSNLHRGGFGTLYTLSKAEKELAIKAAKALKLKVAGVDLIHSERGPLVLEVNSSPGLEGIENATKIDIASKIIECVENNIN